MVETLAAIESAGGGDLLVAFLKEQYPYMLVGNPTPVGATDPVFEHYNPNVLTYPRRLILVGQDLQRQIRSFVIGKLKHDSVVVGDKAYIEYLNREDAEVAKSLPLKCWRIAAWRLRSNS